MKKHKPVITLMIILLAGFFCQAYRQAAPAPSLQLTTWKFDSLARYEANVSRIQGVRITTFTFTNTGNNPLKITDAQPNCPCMTLDWSKDEIAPGKQGFVKISFMPYNKVGLLLESVNVFANTKKGSETIFIKYNVVK